MRLARDGFEKSDCRAQISGRIKRERARESERNKYKREGEKNIER
jgi:hypothetical protein